MQKLHLNILHWILSLALMLSLGGCGDVTRLQEHNHKHHHVEMHKGKTLRFLAWRDCIPEKVYQDLKETAGVHVEVQTYNTSAEFWSFLSEDSSYDVILANQYLIRDLIDDGKLIAINYDNIGYAEDMVDSLQHSNILRPLIKYAFPYLVGNFGIGYNRNHFDYQPRSWSELFSNENKNLFQGQISIFASPREVIAAILKLKNKEINTTDTQSIKEAFDYLKNFMDTYYPHLDTYETGNLLKEGEVFISMDWSADIAKAMKGNSNIRMAIPDEGTISFIMGLAITSTTSDKDLAEFFINYLYSPVVCGTVTNYSYYANTNFESRGFIDPEVLNGPPYYLTLTPTMSLLEENKSTHELYINQWNQLMEYYEKEILPKIHNEILF